MLMKVNLPSKFRLANGEVIKLTSKDVERYHTMFYLHTPNKDEVYNSIVSKGFNVISKDLYYHLRKDVNSLIMDVKIYPDGFIEGSIGISNQMVNVIYEVYDLYKDVYDGLHILYKADWDERKGWIVDIIEYFRIELPDANMIPWKPRIVEIPSSSLGGFLGNIFKRFR